MFGTLLTFQSKILKYLFNSFNKLSGYFKLKKIGCAILIVLFYNFTDDIILIFY